MAGDVADRRWAQRTTRETETVMTRKGPVSRSVNRLRVMAQERRFADAKPLACLAGTESARRQRDPGGQPEIHRNLGPKSAKNLRL